MRLLRQNVKPTSIRYFGDYVLLGEIASGGMGVVFNARQVSLNRRVAVKLIRAGHTASEAELRRFRTEAEAVARLDHPHIVPIYEIGEHEGQPFLAMKLIEGDSLAERIANERGGKGARENGNTALLLAKLARAIEHAHKRGVLHRDIKPGNILIDPEGEPHLTDFGLAKLLERESHDTVSHAILGTPDYMAPEQAAGSIRAVTAASDIYSLGAVFYALLTGQPPFHGQSPGETIEWVRSREPQPPRALNPAVDADLETICLKCLEKDPVRRYLSAQALADDLDRWLAGEAIQARPVGGWERFGKWARRRPAFAGLAVTVVIGGVVGLLGGLWLGQRRGTASSKDFTPIPVKWQTVSGSAIQAEPNHGYRLKATTEVTVTLPTAPATGDVIRLAGAGAGGWRLVQNSNHVILTDNLGAGESGRRWVQCEGDRHWSGVASSRDGTKFVATEFGYRQRGGGIYVSTNGGITWSQRGAKRLWTSCAMSADGGTLAAAAAFGKIYLSTNFGLTWSSNDLRRNWTAIACSVDGRKLLAVDNGTNVSGGHIYTSTDRGLTWTPRESRRNWHFAASSADGEKLAACVGEANVKGEPAFGFVYTSADGGITWTPRLTDRERRWTGIVISSDGRTLCAVDDNSLEDPGGRLFVSLDSGATWNPQGPVRFWKRIFMSPDGRVLIGIVLLKSEDIQQLCISRDLGATWTCLEDNRSWSGVGFSADGRRLVAIAGHFDTGHGSGIFTSVATTMPGPPGSFAGAPGSEIGLEYLGADQFRVLNATGSLVVDGVRLQARLNPNTSRR